MSAFGSESLNLGMTETVSCSVCVDSSSDVFHVCGNCVPSLPQHFACPVYESQSQILNFLSKSEGVHNMVNKFAVDLERITAMFYSVADSNSIRGQVAAITLFMSSYTNSSIVLSGMQLYYDIFELGYTTAERFCDQSSDDVETEAHRTVFEQVRDAFRNWRTFRTSPVATKIMKFLNYMVAVGLCGTNHSLSFSIKDVTIFHMKVQKQEFVAFDMLEYILEVIDFFVTTGYECFLTKSLSPLLIGDDILLEFEKEYSLLMSTLPLLETGRLENLGLDEHDFDIRLEKITLTTQQMLSECTDKFGKNILANKLLQLNKLRTQLIMCQQQGGIREKPFAVLFYGKSGVGKSMLTTTTIAYLRKVNGLPGGMNHVVTLNGNDKFQSEFKTLHDSVILDDLANATKDTTEGNPTTVVIDFVNNIIKSALNPEADKKGKVTIKPKFVVGTTNVKMLDARYYSNEPVSIARRFDFTVTVSVKPEYRIDGSHMVDPSKVPLNKAITDIWELHVERVIPIASADPNSTDEIGYATYTDSTGIDYSKCSLVQFLDLMSVASKKHFVVQKKLVLNNSSVFDEECCQHGRFKCLCQECAFENQAHSIFGTMDKIGDWFSPELKARFDATYEAYDRTRFYRSLTSWLPRNLLSNYMLFNNATQVVTEEPLQPQHFAFSFSFLMTSLLAYLYIPFPFFMLNAALHSVLYILYEELRQNWFVRAFSTTRYYFYFYRERLRQHNGKLLFAGSALLTVGSLLVAYRMWRKFNTQSFTPAPKAEDKERIFPQEEFNPWKKATAESIPVSSKSESISVKELTNLVARNQCHLTIDQGDGSAVRSDAFLVCSNYALIPNHIISDKEYRCHFVRKDPKTTCNNFRSFISKTNTVQIIGTDLALMYVPEGGSNKNLLDYFVNEAPKSVFGEMVYKDAEGNVTIDTARCYYDRKLCNTSASFPGYTYNLSRNTFSGLCCATWIAHKVNPYIFAFHLGGHANRTLGCSGFVSRDSIIEHISRLEQKLCITSCVSSGTFQTESYGVTFAPNKTVSSESPSNFLTPEASIVCYGQHPLGTTRPSSDVVATVISKSVEKHLGHPNVWSSPPFMRQRKWQPWQKYLEGASAPAKGFRPSIVLKAFKDYDDKIKSFLKAEPQWLKRMYVLNEIETVSGIDGFRFVDAMISNTSVGWPLNKSKKQFIEVLPLSIDNITEPKNIDKMFWDEAYRMEKCYLEGERAYPVFRSSLKDEPTKLDKAKSRVFQAAPVALQLLIRKYFLTIIHTLSKNPTVFELAVGTNCTGPEWHNLTEFMCKYGKDRIVAGDFKAFDQHMPAQFTLMSFEILINIARIAGYSERDLIVMKGIATDVAYPLIELNGEFVELSGSNPSGQNMTVYTNSITNSIYHRCAYYTIYENKSVPPFHEVMAIMTYGDDIKGSVRSGFDDLNHTSIALAFESAGIEYTMADKSTTSIPYIKNEDAGFLKRNAVWNEEVNMWFGPLEENSIIKSLHSVVRSKELTAKEASAVNIDGALREYFFHGRSIYEDRRNKLIQVALDCDLYNMCTGLEQSYDARMEAWKTLYLTPESSVV